MIKARTLVVKCHQARQDFLRHLLDSDVDGRGFKLPSWPKNYRKRSQNSTQSLPRLRTEFLRNMSQLASRIYLDKATFWKLYVFGGTLAFTSVLVQWHFRSAMRIINIEDAAGSDTSWQFMNRRHHQYFNQASDALFTARRFLSGAIPNSDAWFIKYSAGEGITYRYGFQNKIWLHILTSRKSPVVLSVTIWRNCRDHWR